MLRYRLHLINLWAWFALTFLVSTIVCVAQQNVSQRPDNSVQSRVVGLIRLEVSVTDGRGNHLSGLSKNNFTVLVDDKPQDIALFNDEDEPSSICILFDRSGSMTGEMVNTEQRKRLLVANLIPARIAAMSHPSNEYILITFNERPNILLDGVGQDGFTAELRRPSSIPIKGQTAIFDALGLGIERLMRAAHRKRVLLLITDEGEDNASQTKWNKLKELAGASGIPIYVISIARGNKVAEELVQLTGGAGFYLPPSWGLRVDTVKMLEEFTSFMARDIRYQYTLGFAAIPADDKWHRIKVKVTWAPNSSRELKRVVVRSREKYYAPVVNSR